MQLDGVQIGVDDLEAAAQAYALLLGVQPGRLPNGTRRFQLHCGAVEIETGEAGLHSIRLVPERNDLVVDSPDSFHGLQVRCEPPPASTPRPAASPDTVEAIDHVVIHTPSVERAIALWRDRLGLRLALDREFPARGLRMAFFRSAGITLEFVSPLAPAADPTAPDRFYGIAYRVGDLAACRARLLQAGLDISGIRPGNKSGTSVATVRSGVAGVPTLLIEDPTRTPANETPPR
jgi:catechol 2,3-dioxygenase-like lactoylglutathione lyase family enzyme